jgi:S-DNA-T family DNA segregation ATPase FtsK/SpoIIIE
LAGIAMTEPTQDPAERGAFHRPPRKFPPAVRTDEVVIARPPTLGQRGVGLVQLLMPVLGTLGIVAFAVVVPNKLFLIVAGAFLAISLASVALTYVTQRRSGKKSARRQRLLYREHLVKREDLLGQIVAQQREAAERLYPDPPRLAGVITGRDQLWERRPADADFLAFRLGRAPLPLACPLRLDEGEDPMTEYEPDLHDEGRDLIDRWRTVDRLPVVTSLAEVNVLTLTGRRTRLLGVARSIVVQAGALRAPTDLRVMVSFAPTAEREWAWLKWLPHARATPGAGDDDAGPGLLLATTAEELGHLLEKQVQPRLEQLRRIEATAVDAVAAAIDAPELLLILDGYHAGDIIARLPLVREVEARGRRLKVRVISLVADGAPEPSEASLRLSVSARGPAVLERTGVRGDQIDAITIDELDAPAAETIARALAPLRLDQSATGIDLNSQVRLTDLFRDEDGSLCAPIGLAEDGTRLVLDLKQPAEGGMGPHGLIVGATGSGKSELLRTIVAGLAAAHGPDELSFVLVDFKGGAAFAELARLPHVAGMITNLRDDLSLVDRMHDALFGEQERRQSLLRAAGNVDDIGAYRALRRTQPQLEPLPHLLVIVDEFGELLANRPDFIDLFEAIGRVGRSLGMHLLLSSQRLEEGRLRGLEGHLRYRICLRTFSAQESKAVLGTPDAYLLPPYPGVGYLSVDTDLYRRFKTALITMPAEQPGPERRQAIRPFTVAAPLTDVASPSGDVGAGPTDLDVLVDRLSHTTGGGRVHQVWLPPLPAQLPLAAVLGTSPWWERHVADEPGGLRACVGLLDLPAAQRQDPLLLELGGGGGHAIIVGAPQTGKSTLLATLLASLLVVYPPSTLQAYLIDLGGGLLGRFAAAPHVGGVAGKATPDRIATMVRQMRALLDEREQAFRESGIDSMAAARARCRAGDLSPETAADVLLVVDNWGALTRQHEELAEELTTLATAGLQYGVHLIASAGRWADVKPAIRDAFGTRLELRLNDPTESDFGRRVADAVPANVPGRGVTAQGLHFQVAESGPDRTAQGAGLGEVVESLAVSLRRHWTGPPASAVRELPERVWRDELAAPSGAGIVLGLAELTLAPVEIDFIRSDQHLLALGDPGSGRTCLLRSVAESLAERFTPEQAELIVVDFRRGLDDLRDLRLPLQVASRPPQAGQLVGALQEAVKRRLLALDESGADPASRVVYVLIDDYELVAGTPMNPLAGLGEIIAAGPDAGVHVVLARSATGMARAVIDPVLSRLLESGAPALLFSGDPYEGSLVRGERAQPLPAGRARLVRRGLRTQLVQLALPGRRLPEDSSSSQPVARGAHDIGAARE